MTGGSLGSPSTGLAADKCIMQYRFKIGIIILIMVIIDDCTVFSFWNNRCACQSTACNSYYNLFFLDSFFWKLNQFSFRARAAWSNFKQGWLQVLQLASFKIRWSNLELRAWTLSTSKSQVKRRTSNVTNLMTISRKFGSRKVQRLTEASSLRAVRPTNLIFNTNKLHKRSTSKDPFSFWFLFLS